jgi:hypothetical protein
MKSFNQRFEDYKLESSSSTSPSDDSYMFWFNNFVNQRSEFNPNNFLTGKIYSFEYMDKLEKGKKFINKRPVVFFTGFINIEEKKCLSGIDLILMPPMVKLPLFNRIDSVYQRQIEENMVKIERGDLNSQIQLKTDYATLNQVMNGIPFKNAYRSWDIKKIRDVKEIPYKDWTRIVYLYTRSIEGTPVEEIYKKNSQI